MIAKYDHLAEVITKPERPEHVASRIYPDVKLTEVLTFDQIVENVVSTYQYPSFDFFFIEFFKDRVLLYLFYVCTFIGKPIFHFSISYLEIWKIIEISVTIFITPRWEFELKNNLPDRI